MSDKAFLSVRVDEGVRSRLKAVAAKSGKNVQDLVNEILRGFLLEAEKRPPELAEVIQRVRGLEKMFRDRHVTGAWLFGSVARGDASPQSDVDMVVDFAPGSGASLFDLLDIKEAAEGAVGRQVDIGTRASMKREVRENAERDLVRVF